MKVALVHDYIKEYGGAERVLETLHAMYPDAPVYTTVYLPEYLGPHKERFKDWDIRTSFLQKVPFKAKLISPFRILSTFAFRSFDFSDFDVVIVSATGAYFPNAIQTKSKKHTVNNNSQLHVCYCHTPPRYLYGYATARNWKKNPVLRVVGELANHFLRMVDFTYAQQVDQFIANSEEVKSRIKKFYRKDAILIYPPVDTLSSSRTQGSRSHMDSRSKSGMTNENEYYLAGGRLARAKHIDLIVRACREQNLPLKVFGKGFAGYESELRSLTENSERGTKNMIEFLGEVSDEEKWELLANAKAYIFAAEDEDFGILPVETMAAGTPVIAYRSGGVKETVIEGKTGIFFDNLTVESLLDALKRFGKTKIESDICRERAEEFSIKRFYSNIQDLMKRVINKS